jgi:hypothetical protein
MGFKVWKPLRCHRCAARLKDREVGHQWCNVCERQEAAAIAKGERRVGPLLFAALCHGCGATCPNTWSDPHGYVPVGGRVYCNEQCERKGGA